MTEENRTWRPFLGERVCLPGTGAGRWPTTRVGVYLGSTRDGTGDRVRWDGAAKPRVITKGHLRPVPAAGCICKFLTCDGENHPETWCASCRAEAGV